MTTPRSISQMICHFPWRVFTSDLSSTRDSKFNNNAKLNEVWLLLNILRLLQLYKFNKANI